MELIKTKEIKELVDNIKDLNSLIVNFDRKKLEDLLLKLQTKYLDKSLVFELSYLTNPNGSFSSIDNVSDDDLKNKIPYYKSLCIDDLIKKCGREKYNEIVGDITKMFNTISVAGTHGKTSTSSMIRHILEDSIGCSYFVGAGDGRINSNSDIFVIESDEFNKHLLTYYPTNSIITNIEKEHMECYKDLQDIIDTFSTFANHTKNRLIACGDNPNCHSLNTKTPITYYGFNEDNDVIIKNHHVAEDGETFDLYFKDKLFDTFTIPVYGKHMVLNATAAIIMCNIYGISKEQIKNSFKTFKNAKRRFAEEKVGNAIIIDDYAHHPTEISATLDAVKRKYKDRRVVAVFKPNTYSRTKDFTNEFVTALSKADKVYLTEIDCNRERQSDYPGVTSNLIVEKIKGAEIISEDTIDKLKNEKDSVVCFMSCAYVNHLIDAFKEIIK